MAKVSFIIPYYNNGTTIGETVSSVLNQTFTDFDVWIIDDGSTDQDSIKKLDEFTGNNKIVIRRQPNAGPSIARNLAIKETNADIIVPLDADDKITPSALEKALPLLLADENTGVVYGNNLLFGSQNELKKPGEFNITTMVLYNSIAMCTFIKKAVFNKSGFFDEYMSKRGLEDWEFWIRIYEDGWKLKYLDETLFEIRVRDDSRTFQVANKNLDDLKSYIYSRHIKTIIREYEKLYYDNKMLKEGPDFKLGNTLLKGYRFLKGK